MHIVIGLGNPGEEYKNTRHNTGRLAADFLSEKVKDIKVLVPDTFMNKTGPFVAKAMNGKSAKNLIIIYDDLDLPLGSMKISFNRSSGGHRGVESIIKALKTEAFIRVRIGISPVTPSGKLKKPKGDKDVEKHILTEFKKTEMEIMKKMFKKSAEAVEMIVEQGLTQAMTEFNSN